MNDEIEYLISRTKKAISLLSEPRMYVKKWGAEPYVKELDLIRGDICSIANNHPEEAKNLMLYFINESDYVFGRTTDKDFVVENFYQKCVENIVEIFAKIPSNIEETTSIAYNIICMNDLTCGHYFNNKAVSSFKELLSKNNGFDRLKNKLTERLNNTKKKKHELICRIEDALDEIRYYMENGIATEYSRWK